MVLLSKSEDHLWLSGKIRRGAQSTVFIRSNALMLDLIKAKAQSNSADHWAERRLRLDHNCHAKGHTWELMCHYNCICLKSIFSLCRKKPLFFLSVTQTLLSLLQHPPRPDDSVYIPSSREFFYQPYHTFLAKKSDSTEVTT